MASAVLPFPHQMAWVLSHLSGLDIDICPSHLTELGERTIGECHISVYQRTNSTGKGIALFTDDVWCVQSDIIYGEIHHRVKYSAVRCFINGAWDEYVIETPPDAPSDNLTNLRRIMKIAIVGDGDTPYRQLVKHTWLRADRDGNGETIDSEEIFDTFGYWPMLDQMSDEDAVLWELNFG